jgi:hypothetical protein
VAGGQRLAREQPERALAVVPALRPQEQGAVPLSGALGEQAVGQVVQVGDEQDPDARVEQGPDDLAASRLGG